MWILFFTHIYRGALRKDPLSAKILLTGSCFTEHIGNHLQEVKFDVLQNPNGILFDPLSVADSLISYIEPDKI